MPEEIEFEAREEQERVAEAHEMREKIESEGKRENAWLRWISVSTAIFAVIAAIAALQSGSLVNEALVQKNESILRQAQASDQWAYYQAKGIKSTQAQATAEVLALHPAGVAAAVKWKAAAARYAGQQVALKTKADALEKQRDARSQESEHLMHRHHTFAYCVTFTQVAIALAAIAALTRRRSMWYLSLLLGLVGLGLFLSGFWDGTRLVFG